MESQQNDVATIQFMIARVAHAIDLKAWPMLRALYADQVETDYSSLFGGTPQRQRGDDLIAGWRKTSRSRDPRRPRPATSVRGTTHRDVPVETSG
jgi:hypothetical protein